MNKELLAGLVALGLPLFAVGFFMLRRNASVFRMYIAMLLIALGYLSLTGAINDIGARVLGYTSEIAPQPATAPAGPAPATP